MENQRGNLIRELYLLMQLSAIGYGKYMKNKIYLHALTIRNANRRIYELLVSHLSQLPPAIEKESLQLLNHYDIWMEQFRLYEKELQPAAGDLFVFHHLDDQCGFPREAEKKIFDYYNTVNTQKENNE
jgi:hypothetical protein